VTVDLFGASVVERASANEDGFAHDNTDAKEEWLTPRWILNDLGPFDLDPCSPVAPPWAIAPRTYTIFDNGLLKPWRGRPFTNPPYGAQMPKWMKKAAAHGCGISLIFARTETKAFFPHIWDGATAFLFIEKRVAFWEFCCARCGAGMSKHKDPEKTGHTYESSPKVIEGESSGAPSMLIAWSDADADVLARIGHTGFSNGRRGKFLMNEKVRAC